MTKPEWLTAKRKRTLLLRLLEQAGERRVRLFGVACCERIWRVVNSEKQDEARHALLTAERYADGFATDEELNSAAWAAEYVTDGDVGTPFMNLASVGEEMTYVVDMATDELFYWERRRLEDPSSTQYALSDERQAALDTIITTEETAQFALLCDIFGNLFRPVTLDPRWQSETVVTLTTGIYAERAFDRMPILADALEEAGCDNTDILSHCRGPGPHVRGCWVVDLLLGKS